MKKTTAVLIALVMLLSFAACGGKDKAETTATAPSQTEEAQTKSPQTANDKGNGKKEDDSGNLLITLYNADSDEYHALKGKIETIDTGIDGEYGMTAFRFVSPKNGVKVRLEGVMWSPIVNDFERDCTYLEITTEKDKIYEFDCCVTETIPDFRLVAEYNGKISEHYMTADGESVKNVIEMTGEDFVPEEITEDSAFYQLCVARAASKVYYEGVAENNDPAVVWDTVAYAVTLNEFKMNGTEDYVNMIGLSEWEADAYFSTLYPALTESDTELPENGNVVAAHFSTGEKYLVKPYTFEKFSTNEFHGVDDNGDGTYSVKIRINDYRFEGYEEFGLAVIVKPDANSPFGYVITDVVDCELPRG